MVWSLNELNDGGNFFPGDGFFLPAKYTAPHNGFYSFTMSIQSYYTLPAVPPAAPRDPIYVRLYTAGAVLKRTYELSYPMFSMFPEVQDAQFSVNTLMDKTDYVTFSYSVLLDTGLKIVGMGAGAGDSYVAGHLVSRT